MVAGEQPLRDLKRHEYDPSPKNLLFFVSIRARGLPHFKSIHVHTLLQDRLNTIPLVQSLSVYKIRHFLSLYPMQKC